MHTLPEPPLTQRQTARIAIVTVSDRASRGEYEDRGGPAAEAWLREVVTSPVEIARHIIPDGREGVAATLRRLAEGEGADLILVTGGTGPAPRDETPEALAEVIEKELPGFGEMKIKALSAVLFKRFGVKAAEGLTPAHPTLGDVDSREALEAYQEKKRAYKAKMRAEKS